MPYFAVSSRFGEGCAHEAPADAANDLVRRVQAYLIENAHALRHEEMRRACCAALAVEADAKAGRIDKAAVVEVMSRDGRPVWSCRISVEPTYRELVARMTGGRSERRAYSIAAE